MKQYGLDPNKYLKLTKKGLYNLRRQLARMQFLPDSDELYLVRRDDEWTFEELNEENRQFAFFGRTNCCWLITPELKTMSVEWLYQNAISLLKARLNDVFMYEAFQSSGVNPKQLEEMIKNNEILGGSK